MSDTVSFRDVVQVGDVIANRYEVTGGLGAGGQGAVVAVRDHIEGDVVALKLVTDGSHPDGVWAEAQFLRTLKDDHILPIRNAHIHLGQPYLVTEIAVGGTIAGRIPSVGLETSQAVRWAQQASQGVERAHDHGLVHNDIKPENLFLDRHDNCLVGDFGMAGKINPTTGIGVAYGGTDETVSPEVVGAALAGQTPPPATRRSDVYSLAATLFKMLSGEYPHDFTGVTDRMRHVATTPPRKIRDVAPHVPAPLARVINSALSVDAMNRPATAIEFANSIGCTITGRRWQRTDEHSGQLACHRGARTGRGDYLMCTTPGAKANAVLLDTVHAHSGRKVANGRAETTRSKWAASARQLMDALP